MKYSFKNDYSEGAHPVILEKLVQSNLIQEPGYGYDKHSENAKTYLRQLVNDENAKIHFISGGTQTNLIAHKAFLRPHEASIAAESGHICVHEAGAIESTGHKIVIAESVNGKLNPKSIDKIIQSHSDEHMVFPKMVYISNPTELGTVYTKDELTALRAYCDAHALYLYCDGARLGTVLCQDKYDLNLEDMYTLTDAFFIGATKVGALLGEALVIRNEALKPQTEFILKQSGALLAKGRLLGIQFESLFESGLYFDLSDHSIQLAERITAHLRTVGCDFLVEPETNQLFPILSNEKIEVLQKNFDFYVWKEIDDNYSAIRLITSWATSEEAVSNLIQAL